MQANHDTGGGLYLSPLYYDVINTPGTAAEVNALEIVARQHATRSGPGARWLEPACGTGRYLRVLRRRGYRVAGYDPLPSMLAMARRRMARWPDGWSLSSAAFTTPARELAGLGRFDVACCTVNSLRHLADDDSMLAHLAQVGTLLDTGGVYLVGLDLHDPDRLPDEDVWTGARGRLRVKQVVQYLPPKAGQRFEEVVVAMQVDRPRAQEFHHWSYRLRTYRETQWRELLERSALRRVATYDGGGRLADGSILLPYQIEVLVRRDTAGPRGV